MLTYPIRAFILILLFGALGLVILSGAGAAPVEAQSEICESYLLSGRPPLPDNVQITHGTLNGDQIDGEKLYPNICYAADGSLRNWGCDTWEFTYTFDSPVAIGEVSYRVTGINNGSTSVGRIQSRLANNTIVQSEQRIFPINSTINNTVVILYGDNTTAIDKLYFFGYVANISNINANAQGWVNNLIICYTPLAEESYTITATAGTGGTITPSGAVNVTAGEDVNFDIQPLAGYVTDDVLVDGVSVGAVNSYYFNDVMADHTIEAIFTPVGAINQFYAPFTSDQQRGGYIYEPYTFSYDGIYAALSVDNNASVHAPFDGQVYIQDFSILECDQYYRQLLGSVDCGIAAPTDDYEGIDLVGEYDILQCANRPGDYAYCRNRGVGGTFYYEDRINRVRVVNGELGISAEYLVYDARKYLTNGQTITGGCIIGEALNIYDAFVNAAVTDPVPVGVVLINFLDVDLQENIPGLETLLTVAPSAQAPCNANPDFADCLSGDPELRSPDFWQVSGAVEFTDPGAAIFANSSITQQLNLDAGEDYGVIVQGRRSSVNQVMNFSLGLGQEVVQFATGNAALLLAPNDLSFSAYIPTASYAADLGGQFYSLFLSNNASETLLIDSICVYTGAPRQPISSACYFRDPGFDQQYDISPSTIPWSGSVSGTYIDPQNPGEVAVYDGGFIAHDATLYPEVEGEPYTYTLTVEARLLATGDYTGANGEAQLYYVWSGGGGTQLIGDVDQTVIDAVGRTIDGTVDRERLYRFEGQFTVSTETVGSITISVDGDINGELLGFRIDKVCLTAPSFPGYEPPPPFEATCSLVPRPVGTGIGDWITFLWNSLDNFFQCDLMTLLRRLYDLLRDLYTLIGWIARYIIATMQYSADWLGSDLFPWLNGHFANIAIGRNTTIEGGGGAGFWDAIIALINGIAGVISSALAPLIDAIGDLIAILLATVGAALLLVIGGLLAFLYLIFSRIFDLIELVLGFFSSIVLAWNTAAPVVPAGLPNCAINPQDQGWCIFLYVAENTILSGAGSLIIPLIVGFGYIHLVLNILIAIRRTAVDFGNTT